MSQCPNCQNEIAVEAKDMGALFTCPSCKAIYFINFDGAPEYDPNPQVYNPVDYQENLDAPAAEGSLQAVASENQPAVNFDPDAAQLSPEPMSFESVDLNEMSPEELNYNSEELGLGAEDALVTTEGNEVEAKPEAVTRPRLKSVENADLKEIVDFGNATDNNPSGIMVDLTLSGIDSKNITAKVKDALTDAKFLWDTEKLMSEIKNGELKLVKVSPLKAAIIVARLRFEDVKIDWEQNEI